MQKQNAVTVGCQLLNLLFDHQNGDAGAGQGFYSLKDLIASLRIQLGGRLVQDHHIRAHDQHTGDRHALHLAAGQIKGIAVPVLPDIQKL